jgi:DNA repair exonuclease SbcCD nuclease subunit
MKIALITDQHFGARSDSTHFLDFYEKFYRGTFFPTLDAENIQTVLILGDTFDRRKYVNFYSFKRSKEMFFDILASKNIQVHMLVGNHDTTFKNTNEVNSPELLLQEYSNINVIDSPKTLQLGDYEICMMPWICAENYDDSMNELKTTKAQLCMGHFEIEGFQMYRGAPSHEGLSPDLFRKFDMTFSGHYHHKSSNGNIHYLGNPYELTWQDYNDDRGFHILNLSTRELSFIKNPNSMFYRLVYDDKQDDIQTLSKLDMSNYSGVYVKVVVVNKTNPYLFDVFMNNLYQVNPIDVTIVEDSSDIDEELAENAVDQTEDTITILNKYVDNIATDLDKDKVKNIIREMYIEALNADTEA